VVLARVAETTTAVSERIVVSAGVVACAAAREGHSAIAVARTAKSRTNGRWWNNCRDILKFGVCERRTQSASGSKVGASKQLSFCDLSPGNSHGSANADRAERVVDSRGKAARQARGGPVV